MPRPRKNAGFSLLEVMIASGVLTFAMITVLTMVIQASTTQQAARETEIAKEAAMAQLSRIKMGDYDAVAAFHGSKFAVESLNGARGNVSIDASNPDLAQIVVTVTWKGRRGDSSYSMRSLCAR